MLRKGDYDPFPVICLNDFNFTITSIPTKTANMKPYASQVTNSLAKSRFHVDGRRKKTNNDLFSAQK